MVSRIFDPTITIWVAVWCFVHPHTSMYVCYHAHNFVPRSLSTFKIQLNFFFNTNSFRFLYLCKTSHVRYKSCHPQLVSKSKHKSLSSHNSVSRESFQYFNIIFGSANFSFLVFVKFISQYLINIFVVGSHVFLDLLES